MNFADELSSSHLARVDHILAVVADKTTTTNGVKAYVDIIMDEFEDYSSITAEVSFGVSAILIRLEAKKPIIVGELLRVIGRFAC